MGSTAARLGNYLDAELDLGIVAFDASDATAAANTTKLNAALAGMRTGGANVFADRHTGPVNRVIVFSGKTFYFKGIIRTNDRIGGAIYGSGGGGYGMGSDEFLGNGTYGGMKTRIIRTDGQNGGPVISLHGSGFELNGLDIYGRQYTANNGSGTQSQSCIRIEAGGVANPHYRGLHIIVGCGLHEATYGIHCVDGYYDSDETYHADENHADMCYVRSVDFFNCSSCFRSENKQTLCWNFNRITVNSLPGSGIPSESIVFDMVKGGALTATGVTCNFSKVVLLSVQDSDYNQEYEYGTQSYDIRGLYWDAYSYPTFNNTNTYFTIFRYAGYHYGDLNFPQKHLVRVSGVFAQYNGLSSDLYYDKTKLVDLGGTPEEGLVTALELFCDIMNLPTADFALSGNGPWYRWSKTYSHRHKMAAGTITPRGNYIGVEVATAPGPENLTNITAVGMGTEIILKAYDDTHTVVVKNGTGNIFLAGSDFTLDNAKDTLKLVCDGTNWLEVSRSNNGA